ncbi:MAG: sodium:proton antiporter [Syntrophobacteraceae bacterium]
MLNQPIWTYFPFGIVLLMIAVMPLAFPRFWSENRNKAIVCMIIALPVFLFNLVHFPDKLLASIEEYICFILMLSALFIISGGILVEGDLKASPGTLTIFLLIGAVISNLIGTTGASMLLIRPLLQTISERKHIFHIPVFFIFVVSNIGGSLTPLGDPPLFLGYIRGVPFTWTLGLLPQWIVAVGILLGVFYVWDRHCYGKEAKEDVRKDEVVQVPLSVKGKINIVFLMAVVLSIFFQTPAPVRELAFLAAIALSLWFTKKEVREQNKFTYHPIIEVAVLFAAIFVTMVPWLSALHKSGGSLGITEPWQFFWITGGLSSFLDNAPTYVALASLGESVTRTLAHTGTVVSGIGVRADLLAAISCGAVFMGACTYIGNGPNLMVKSIAEEQGIKVPHFFQYMLYSAVVLIPIFMLVTFLFFV